MSWSEVLGDSLKRIFHDAYEPPQELPAHQSRAELQNPRQPMADQARGELERRATQTFQQGLAQQLPQMPARPGSTIPVDDLRMWAMGTGTAVPEEEKDPVQKAIDEEVAKLKEVL